MCVHICNWGDFTKYNDFKEWILQQYSLSNSVNFYCDQFFHCAQQKGESVNDYYHCFIFARSLLDKHLDELFAVYLFIDKLYHRLKKELQRDWEFATYEEVTLSDVLGKIKRLRSSFEGVLLNDLTN